MLLLLPEAGLVPEQMPEPSGQVRTGKGNVYWIGCVSQQGRQSEAMMKSARRKKKLECKMFGEECPDEIIPSADEILSCYYLSENAGLITAVLQTMKESQTGTVEIKEKKGKNGESHASK